jgi:hypothetical protein
MATRRPAFFNNNAVDNPAVPAPTTATSTSTASSSAPKPDRSLVVIQIALCLVSQGRLAAQSRRRCSLPARRMCNDRWRR